MQVRQRLRASAVGTAASAALLLLVLFLALYRSSRAIDSSETAADIIAGSLERLALQNDYCQNDSERARVQWFARHERIGALLRSASAQFRDPEDRETIATLIRGQAAIGATFEQLVRNREKERLHVIPAGLSRDTEDRLLSQLNMKLYETVINGRTLEASSRTALFAAFKLAGWGLFLLLGIVIVAAAFNAWSLDRAITDRIDRLREGTAVIGSGVLDYRIDLEGDDEFAELGAAFNGMTARLSATHRDLEAEIEERTRAEQALRKAHDELDLRVQERTRELQDAKGRLRKSNESLEARVAERTAELHAAVASLSDSRRAALNMMEDAVAARRQAEEMSGRLRREVFERRLAEEALQHSVRRFELLAQTAAGLLQAAVPQELVESLCREVMAYLDCQVFFNFLTASDETGRLRLNAYAGISDEDARRIEWLDYGVAVCGCVARDAQRIVAEHIDTTPDERTALVKSFGVLAYCCHPLLGPGGRVIGTLSFGTRTRETLSESDISLMQAVSDLVAVAMSRMETTERLRRTAAELARSNQDLAQYAYVASHDLQEPLRMVSGFVSLLQQRYGGHFDEKGQDFIARALEGTTRMRQLIDDLLEYGRVDRGERSVAPVPTRGVFDAVLANLATMIAESGAEVSAGELPTILGDQGRLVVVLQNLIANAITYRCAGMAPRVRVEARRQGRSWVFSVADNGIGIPQEQFERIFFIFQRLHTRDRYPGTGLGLAIVKKIVEAEGGRVWVESRVGEGSTFFFSMPGADDSLQLRNRCDSSAESGWFPSSVPRSS